MNLQSITMNKQAIYYTSPLISARSSLIKPSSSIIASPQDLHSSITSSYQLPTQKSIPSYTSKTQSPLTMSQNIPQKFTSPQHKFCLSKKQRCTLPAGMIPQQLCPGLTKTIARSQKRNTTVKFTYNRAEQPSRQYFTPYPSQQLIPSVQGGNSRISSKIAKKLKNQLCSNQFQMNYNPTLEGIRRRNKQLQDLLHQLKKQSDILSSRTSIYCRNKDSNLTADETNISAFSSAKGSGSELTLAFSGSKWSHLSQQQKPQSPLFQLARPSLADRLPSQKMLNKTIILNNGYDFGGLVPQAKITTHNVDLVRQEKEGHSWNGWNNSIKGLLHEQEGSDMKESIHCGPEVRAQRFECEMLRGFGREIKESIMDV